jgi:hypothetical protein
MKREFEHPSRELVSDPLHSRASAVLHLRDKVGHTQRVLLSDGPTDRRTIKGDLEYSPGHHNFGDYISLSADDRRFAAAWTDGREGRSRIHVRVVKTTIANNGFSTRR